MINKIVVENHRNQILELELKDAGKSTGLLVDSVDGLDAGSVTVYMRERGSYDGGVSGSSRKGIRNIVLTLKFREQPDVESARHSTYKYFPLKKKISLTIYGDHRISGISGIVESNEAVIFSKESFAQISILCEDPYFVSKDIGKNTETLFYGSEPLFEFPFENDKWETITIGEPPYDKEVLVAVPELQFGEIHDIGLANIYYDGDVSTGIYTKIDVLADKVGLITLYNTSLGQSMRLKTNILNINGVVGSLAGDSIEINSVDGKKGVILLRKGVRYNVFNIIDMSSHWITLDSGDNLIGFDCEKGADKLAINIINDTLYAGV